MLTLMKFGGFKELDGKVAIVVGGAGGMGRAIVHLLDREGAYVLN
jgi:NAD(P)-dependent dehydrogenase (short-subunit alcohol dehydrogenase family)